MNRKRMIMASRHAIRLTFSHGKLSNSSAPISRFFGTNSQKTLHSWLYQKKLWTRKHGAIPLSDHLMQYKNQDRALHQQNEAHTDMSVADEFEELGPAISSLPEANFRSLQDVPQKERKSFGIPTSYGNRKYSMMDDQGEDGDVKKGSCLADLVSVAIDNVPADVNDGQLRDAVCAFGEVKAMCVSAEYNGLSSYCVEFKDRESRETALNSGEVTIGNYTLTINHTKTPRLLRIRTNKVHLEMSELAMHPMFNPYGHLKGLISRNDGAIDVFFQVDGEIEAERLINKLEKDLVQEVQLQELKAVKLTCEKSEFNFERELSEIRKKQELRSIYLEDLEHLYSAISHIKALKDSWMHVKNTRR